MNKLIIVILILSTLFIFTGCTSDTIDSLEADLEEIRVIRNTLEEENQMLTSEIEALEQKVLERDNEISELKSNQVPPAGNLLEIFSVDNNSISYAMKPDDFYSYHIITVNSFIGLNESPVVENEIDIDTGKGEERLVVTVIGSVYNFQLVNIEWDEKTNLIVERDVVYSLPQISNSNVNIMTIFPEGMPSEKVKWEDEAGRLHEYYISYSGIGIQGVILLPEK